MKTYKNEWAARRVVEKINKAAKKAGSKHIAAVGVPGPSGGWVIVDLPTAISLGLGYIW